MSLNTTNRKNPSYGTLFKEIFSLKQKLKDATNQEYETAEKLSELIARFLTTEDLWLCQEYLLKSITEQLGVGD